MPPACKHARRMPRLPGASPATVPRRNAFDLAARSVPTASSEPPRGRSDGATELPSWGSRPPSTGCPGRAVPLSHLRQAQAGASWGMPTTMHSGGRVPPTRHSPTNQPQTSPAHFESAFRLRERGSRPPLGPHVIRPARAGPGRRAHISSERGLVTDPGRLISPSGQLHAFGSLPGNVATRPGRGPRDTRPTDDPEQALLRGTSPDPQ